MIQTNPIYHLANKTIEVGEKNPITLPLVDMDKIAHTFGKKLATGNTATIYSVKNCTPSRVYKVIALREFESGNEVRISKIAADIGIAPAYHNAFVVKQDSKKFVVIEMDNAGESLGKWMKKLATKSEPIPEQNSSSLSKEMQAFLSKMKAENPITVTEITENKLTLEEVLPKLYNKPEDFYFELFSKIKILAEHFIAYGDTHVGNIMPQHGTDKGMQLIDFGSGDIMKDSESAAFKAMSSLYNQVLLNKFEELPNLSKESLGLIKWFY
ncbi:MAG: hypothetical protein K1000chlam2_01528 [Chlamydiae bacterium]|nr:hypothetical protein [Chlamydiota bacterium]